MYRVLVLILLVSVAPACARAQSASGERYVHERSTASDALARLHVPFSFTLPEGWRIYPDAASRGSFVEAYRPVAGHAEGEASEIVTFFPVVLPSPHPTEAELLAELEATGEAVMADWSFHDVESEEIDLDAESTLPSLLFYGGDDDEDIWARLIVAPTGLEQGRAGVGLGILVLGSTLAAEIQGPDDVGFAGEAPLLLETLILHETTVVSSAPGSSASPNPAPARLASPASPSTRSGGEAPAGHYVCYTYGYAGPMTSSSLTQIRILPGSRMEIVGEVVPLAVDGSRLVLRGGTFAGAVAHVRDDSGKPKIVFVREENEALGHRIDMSDTYCYLD